MQLSMMDVPHQLSAGNQAFEVFWLAYPKRDGGNPKRPAWNRWKALLRNGAASSDIMEGLTRYAASLERKGKIGTEFVMQAQTFLGPGERWCDDYGEGDEGARTAWRLIETLVRDVPLQRCDGAALAKLTDAERRALGTVGGVADLKKRDDQGFDAARLTFYGLCREAAS